MRKTMFKPSKSVLSFGAGALALGVLILAAPRAAHALAATLVQVTNTSANPAITQSVLTQASQLVSLYGCQCLANEVGLTNYYSFIPQGAAINSAPYTVPANQSLVVTDIDASPFGCGTVLLNINASIAAGPSAQLYLQGPVAPHVQYRSGVVFPPGSAPGVQTSGCPELAVYLHGYLTSN
jgi:hypothetical protein